MIKFLIKSLLFTLIILGILLFFSSKFKRKYNLKTDYLAAIIDKENRAKSIKADKILFVGGSNLAFGINSEEIEKQLNHKVVNLGLHAGLSLKFMLNQAQHLSQKGDIVILNLEYPLYLDNFNPDIDLIQFTQELYPASKKYYEFNLKEQLESEYERFKKYFEEQEFKVDSVFNRELFNNYGDNIGHLNKKPLVKLIDRQPIDLIEISNSIKLLQDFETACQAKGVLVYITFPCYPKSEFVGQNKERIIRLVDLLYKKTPGIKILGTPEENTFPDNYFYDTIYHLNAKGREFRTQILINDLKSVVTSANP